MSSPSNVSGNNASVGIREGTRVILREITANLHNSPPGTSPKRKTGNEAASNKIDQQQQQQQQHQLQQQQQQDVKVRFIREFADASTGGTGREGIPETSSLSSASSFQSLASTLSSKCSSGICVDSSPNKNIDTSYLNSDISGLDDLISACENIRLDDTSKDPSFELKVDSEDNHSPDATFRSASDRTSLDRSRDNSPLDHSRQPDKNLNLTTETEEGNLVDRNLNITTEIIRGSSPINCQEVVDDSVDEERNRSNLLPEVRDNSLGNSGNEEQFHSDVATEIGNESLTLSHELDVHSDPNVTTVITRDDSPSPLSFDLDKTRAVTNENLATDCSADVDFNSLDTTREITREFSSLNSESEGGEAERKDCTIDKDSLTIDSHFHSQDSLGTDFASFGFEKSNETFVQCVSDIGKLSESSGTEKVSENIDNEAELAKTEDSLETLKFKNNEDDRESKKYEEYSLESITPSLSQFHGNLSPSKRDEKIEVSPVKTLSDINVEEFKRANDLDEFSDRSKILKQDSGKNLQITNSPALPIIPFPADLHESTKLLPVEDSTKKINSKGVVDEIEESIPKKESKEVEEEKELLQDKEVEKEESLEPEVEAIGAEIDEECFPEVEGKRENEDLDTTVKAEDSSSDEIIGGPEPKRQSTSIVPQRQKLETEKSVVVAGTIAEENSIPKAVTLNDEYSAFVPQKQSTTLDNFVSPLSSKLQRQRTPFLSALSSTGENLSGAINSKTSPGKRIESFEDRCNFAKLELAANSVANDIFNTSLELAEENEHFVSAESEVFHDPTNFDFLLRKTPKKNTKRDLRDLSLYVKFDPLVSNTSMLPQGNIQHASPPASEAQNGDDKTTITNIGTPKRNPAIAAIDRLLFYSPMSTNATPTNTNTTIQKTNDAQEKLKPSEETSEETVNMAKELELVRTTVLQLEEQLEKLKIDHEEALEKQASYKEKINQLQAQLAQEIKNKNEITVVVDEYEISISRLVAERERDRKNLDLEKAKLQEELAAAKHHLDNTEAAFNDVHLKYERLKAVVATYKNNEAALKESLQENVEIIKSLENRYEQVKSHATARLEKANQELDEIRKQNESETVRLHAMLRKAELKSNSLAELVEQKTKENQELTQILDEVIARVGRNKAE